MGRRFKREGTYVYLRLIHVDVWQKPTLYCKAIILLQINNFFKDSLKKQKNKEEILKVTKEKRNKCPLTADAPREWSPLSEGLRAATVTSLLFRPLMGSPGTHSGKPALSFYRVSHN